MKYMNGYTVFEILVAIIIIAILMGIGIIPLKNAKKQFDIEQDMRNIYGILQKGRMYAFTNKQAVYLDLNDWCLKREIDNVHINCITVRNNLSHNCNGSKITINERGIFSNFCTIYYLTDLNPVYNCVSVSLTRAKMGVYNGSCVEK